MIKRFEIKWFKSIRHVVLDCRRVNVFIGKPNTGKSNILEVIGFLGHFYYGDISDFVRLDDMTDLFYHKDTSHTVEVAIDDIVVKVFRENDLFLEKISHRGTETKIHVHNFNTSLSYRGASNFGREYKFYRFKILKEFKEDSLTYLKPPYGENLVSLLVRNSELRRLFRDILREYGYKLDIREFENKVELKREIEEDIYHSPSIQFLKHYIGF